MDKLVIHLDSGYTNIFKLGSGVVLSEPTVVAVSSDEKKSIKAVGNEAKKLIGKTAENTKIIFPVFEGEIVNESACISMLSDFFRKIELKSRVFGNEAIVAIPCGATSKSIEKYANVVKNAGISRLKFIEAPLLSAFSQNLPLTESAPCFVVDMAGGATSISAVTKEGVIAGFSVNFGANNISTDIIDYVAEYFSLQIGLLSAERLKNEIGSLVENDGLSTVVNGRDLKTGVPRSCSIKAMDILPAIKIYYDKIAEIANSLLVKLPPEVSAEIRNTGIFLSGVGAKIYGLSNYYSEKFNMLINIPNNPEYSVVLGGGVVIADKELLKKISIKID